MIYGIGTTSATSAASGARAAANASRARCWARELRSMRHAGRASQRADCAIRDALRGEGGVRQAIGLGIHMPMTWRAAKF
jgi:hypothetical protein